MADPLYKSLRPATFRGVAFQVESGGIGAGRRVQVHEYPQRDKPYAEDLGRAARKFRVQGFVVGRDYIDQANKLLAALETAGPGQLVHPWHGTLNVTLDEPASLDYDMALGVAKVSMSFVEAGELVFPAAGAATQTGSRTAASKIEDAAVRVFEKKFSVKGMPQFVRDMAGNNIAKAVTALTANAGLASLLGYAGQATSIVSRATALYSNPLGLAQTLAGFIGLSGPLSTGLLVFRSGTQLYSAITGLLRVVGGPSLNPAPYAGVYTLQRAQADANQDAIMDLTRQMTLAQAVGLSGDLQATVYDDVAALRGSLVAALDAEAFVAGDDAFAALQDARAAVYADLTTRSRDSARLVTYTPPTTLPALVTAYDRYEDALRDAEIVERNKIARPGFVPPAPLKLLSR